MMRWGYMSAKKDTKALITALNAKDLNVRYQAAEALAEVGDAPAIESLPQVLRIDEDQDVRWAAKKALIAIGKPVVPSLHQALRYKDALIRRYAVRVLGKIREVKAASPLLRMMADEQLEVRRTAVEALRKLGDTAIIVLLQVLKSDSWETRMDAAWALGEIGNSEIIPPLI